MEDRFLGPDFLTALTEVDFGGGKGKGKILAD